MQLVCPLHLREMKRRRYGLPCTGVSSQVCFSPNACGSAARMRADLRPGCVRICPSGVQPAQLIFTAFLRIAVRTALRGPKNCHPPKRRVEPIGRLC